MNMEPARFFLAEWPRLMNEEQAAHYLSIGTTTLREVGPKPKKIGRQSIWDRRDLDRWADQIDDQPLSNEDAARQSARVEEAFLEARRRRKSNG